jgi:hypothetical protein
MFIGYCQINRVKLPIFMNLLRVATIGVNLSEAVWSYLINPYFMSTEPVDVTIVGLRKRVEKKNLAKPPRSPSSC